MQFDLKKTGLTVICFGVGLFIVHFLTLRAFPNFLNVSVVNLVQQYSFLFVLTIAHFVVLSMLIKKWPKYFGFLFTVLSFLKMLIAILFLLPFIREYKDLAQAFVLNFMVVYLSFLTVEVILLLKNVVNYHKK